MEACSCELGFSNTGFPGCVPISKVAKKFAIVPLRDGDGNFNSIGLGDTIDQAYLDARINDTDKSKRWYVTEAIDNVIDVRGDAVVFALDSGEELFVKEGERTFTGVFAKTGNDPVYLGKLKAARCQEFGVFVFDKSGNIIGNGVIEPGKLRPIAVTSDTWIPGLTKATDSAPQLVTLQFGFDPFELDEDIRMIVAGEISASVLKVKGLLDVNIVYSAISATGFTATMTLDYGSAKNPIKVEGLLLADFLLEETSPTPGTIVPASVTESAPSAYDFVVAAQGGGDIAKLSIIKAGLEAKANEVTF